MLKTSLHLLPNGQRVRVARLGSGPPLVMLHGYPDNLQIWCKLAPRLAHRFETIAFDWPGMGRSDPWPGGAAPSHMGSASNSSSSPTGSPLMSAAPATTRYARNDCRVAEKK